MNSTLAKLPINFPRGYHLSQ